MLLYAFANQVNVTTVILSDQPASIHRFSFTHHHLIQQSSSFFERFSFWEVTSTMTELKNVFSRFLFEFHKKEKSNKIQKFKI